MTTAASAFDAGALTLRAGGVLLAELSPLIDGKSPACGVPQVVADNGGWTITWQLADGRFVLGIRPCDGDILRLAIMLEGLPGDARIDAIGLKIGTVTDVVRYLRNGYTSWDGSYFVEPDAARDIIEADPRALTGHAMTALISRTGETAVLGFLRHDRFQSRLRFALGDGSISICAETLIDRTAHDGRAEAESLVLIPGIETEETLRRWARKVAAASPLAPRTPARRISGWCSWYSLYASIDEPVILEHLAAAQRFRDQYRAPFDVFQIDDGFAPEMGDWLTVKPQFPRGMKPLLADIRAAGFTPGLWIAPFMVGNRSELYAQHPDWVVTDPVTGKPVAPMKFYGEFRWHKRSEEYYVLDITHPQAEAYIRRVFRTWRHDWGCGYFKTDFMYFGSEYGPEQARWHTAGLSRIEIWMRMARLIREEIGDALWLSCGSPIWAGVGLVDAVRIGRDVGVSWKGHYSAESLLRDQTSRNFANGLLWQADPDCILLRDRFHELSEEQVRSLALFAGLAGGVLMTSDHLDEVPAERRALLAHLAGDGQSRTCDFPRLGQSPLRHRMGVMPSGTPMLVAEGDPVLVQRVRQQDGTVLIVLINTGEEPTERSIEWALSGLGAQARVKAVDTNDGYNATDQGARVTLPPYAARSFLFSRP